MFTYDTISISILKGIDMILIACVDVNNGMLFNNGRQSRDKVLMEHIIELVSNKRLWINSFSKDIFGNFSLYNADIVSFCPVYFMRLF